MLGSSGKKSNGIPSCLSIFLLKPVLAIDCALLIEKDRFELTTFTSNNYEVLEDLFPSCCWMKC